MINDKTFALGNVYLGNYDYKYDPIEKARGAQEDPSPRLKKYIHRQNVTIHGHGSIPAVIMLAKVYTNRSLVSI